MPLIPVRVPRDAALHVIRADDPFVVADDHPMADHPCPVCGGPLKLRPVVLVYVGMNPEYRRSSKRWVTGMAVAVHADEAGVFDD